MNPPVDIALPPFPKPPVRKANSQRYGVVYLPPEVHARLKEAAGARGVAMGTLAAYCLNTILDALPEPTIPGVEE